MTINHSDDLHGNTYLLLYVGDLSHIYEAHAKHQLMAERKKNASSWAEVHEITVNESYPQLMKIQDLVKKAFFGE